MKIYLVRHGEKVPEKGNPGLTPKGKNQVKALGKFFKTKKIDKIISSPLRRAIETSKIISSEINLPYSVDSGLKERLSFGDVKDQTYPEYLKLIRNSSLYRDLILPNGESSMSVGKKIEETIRGIDKKYKRVIVVAHGGSISDFLRNIFSEKILVKKSQAYYAKLEVQSASITQITFTETGFKLVELNKVI